jgi:hypothetical protein
MVDGGWWLVVEGKTKVGWSPASCSDCGPAFACFSRCNWLRRHRTHPLSNNSRKRPRIGGIIIEVSRGQRDELRRYLGIHTQILQQSRVSSLLQRHHCHKSSSHNSSATTPTAYRVSISPVPSSPIPHPRRLSPVKCVRSWWVVPDKPPVSWQISHASASKKWAEVETPQRED